MITVTKAALPDLDDYIKYLRQIWSSGQFTNSGALVRRLRADVSSYLGIDNFELVANGTLALQLAIKALELNGEIITTPYSYVATTNAIIWEGCVPVFVDIEPNSFCIDPDLIEAAITEKTSAILATHVYGYPCDVDKIQRLAEKFGIKVIYDAAHCFGVRWSGKSLLAHGDCSALSLHATKLFHTAEGGAVFCENEDIKRKIFLMSKFGHLGEDEYLDVGINAKMSELHAAMGLALLPKVDEIIAARKQCSVWYDEFLADTPLQRPSIPSGLEYNYGYYPILFANHEQMMLARQSLHEHGIAPRRYFYPSLNNLPFLAESVKNVCPVSESVASRVLCLPMYVGLERDSIGKISEILISSALSKAKA